MFAAIEVLARPGSDAHAAGGVLQVRSADAPETYTQKMKRKIDTPEGRSQHSRRVGIVEPVFAHICSILGLRRFSLRGRIKVDIQWKLYVHNMIKVHRYGFRGG